MTGLLIVFGMALAFAVVCIGINLKAKSGPIKWVSLSGMWLGLTLALIVMIKVAWGVLR